MRQKLKSMLNSIIKVRIRRKLHSVVRKEIIEFIGLDLTTYEGRRGFQRFNVEIQDDVITIFKREAYLYYESAKSPKKKLLILEALNDIKAELRRKRMIDVSKTP